MVHGGSHFHFHFTTHTTCQTLRWVARTLGVGWSVLVHATYATAAGPESSESGLLALGTELVLLVCASWQQALPARREDHLPTPIPVLSPTPFVGDQPRCYTGRHDEIAKHPAARRAGGPASDCSGHSGPRARPAWALCLLPSRATATVASSIACGGTANPRSASTVSRPVSTFSHRGPRPVAQPIATPGAGDRLRDTCRTGRPCHRASDAD